MLRIAQIAIVAALTIAPATTGAQTPPTGKGETKIPGQKPASTPPATPDQPAAPADVTGAVHWTGFLDFGVRGTDLTGDPARYERYRDMSDGLFLELAQARREIKGWLFAFDGEHVGREDQRFTARAVDPGKYRASFLWDQIPMLLSRTTRTLYTGIGSDGLSIDDALQAQVQAQPSALATVFAEFSRQFDTKTRRHLADGSFEYVATDALMFSTRFRRTDRDGTIPFGGSFGHSSLVEFPAPTEHNLTEFDVGAEYQRDPVLLRAGYNGSWFHNDITTTVFDNPFRATDISSTPARGRLTLAPSNSFIGVNGLASVKLPYKSRATAYASLGMLEDAGDPLLPQTINSVNVTTPLERQTVNGEARTSSVNLRFTSRPKRYTDIVVSYRGYEYDNRTPELELAQRVAYDNTPSTLSPPIHTEPYGLSRGTFDADFRVLPTSRTSAGVGYTRLSEDRTHRIFENTTDNVFRLTFDAFSQSWFSVRSKYEHAQRRGEGIEQGEELLAEIGEQPELRHFDIASRDRDRITVIGTITPTGVVAANLSFAAGKDDYLESVFGLRDNTHQVYTVGADYLPNDRVTMGASYSYEEYNALQRSRQANPGVQFTDPSRNWAADSSDRTHSLILNADVNRIAEKINLRFTYDFSRSRARYDYITGPVPDRTLPEEVPVPTTLPTPTELPPTLSELQRGTADFVYTLTNRLSLGLSYWYERYRVEDFTLDVDANPDLVRGQALLLGYLYRPYTANTFWGRLLYRF